MSDSASAASSQSSAAANPSPPLVVPTLSELFAGFFKVTMTGFGGILPWARREFVQVRRWMTQEEFNELFAICQFLPGPNIVSFSIIYGHRLYGIRGVAAAVIGLLGPPVVLMIAAGTAYNHYGELPVFRGGLTGLAAAAAGLLIASAAQMAEPMIRRRHVVSLIIACATVVAVGVLQFPLVWVLAVMIPLSIALAWRQVT